MTAIEDESFDVVLDKVSFQFHRRFIFLMIFQGALDALYTEATDERTADTCRLFAEIFRVLNTNGVYICITLAQKHILETLVNYFADKATIV